MSSLDRKSFLKVAATAGLGVLCGAAAYCRERGVNLTKVEHTSLIMGSAIQFTVYAESEREGYEAIRRAVAQFRQIDRKLSMYRSDSETARVSQAAGRNPVAISPETEKVLTYAKKVWRQSNRLFDVTVEPGMRRWGFRHDPGSGKISRPSDKELRRLKSVIGSDKLHLSAGTAYLDNPGMGIDLGGIAGGYALDRAIAEMKQGDAASGLINFSGDIHCFGSPPDRSGWPVHIYNPVTGAPLPEPVLLHDEALSTSGAYQNRRGRPQEDWGHLIHPAQAAPLETVQSLTAVATSAMSADAWSTAGYLGADRKDDLRWIAI